MSTLFYRNRHLLALSIVVLLVGGLSAAFTLPRLEDPRIRNRFAVIVTALPGASAERIEALVTEKLEEELREVSEIDTIQSTSRSGVSLVTVELDGRITDTDTVWSKIRDEVADAERLLPPEASKPTIDIDRAPPAFTLLIGVTAAAEGATPNDDEASILTRLADELADRLRNVPATDLVRVYGEAEEEITVTVDSGEIAALGLDAAGLARAVGAADAKAPSGTLRGASSDLLIEVAGELDSLERIAAIPLRGTAGGELLRLGDVAAVERSRRSPARELALAGGRPAVIVAARVEAGQQVDRWARAAGAAVDAFEAELGGGAELVRIFDQSRYTMSRLGELARNLLLGGVIVVAVVLFTMGWRSALLVGAAVPLSASAVLFGLSVLGVPLHQMSVTGLIIALGLLIDNAIVTVDEVHRRMRETSRLEAIRRTIRHLFVPLLGSTLTTVLAFAPILLLSGNVGEFVRTMAVSVILAITSSFAVAMTVLPALTALFGRSVAEGCEGHWWQCGFESHRLTALYRRAVEGAIRRPLLGVAAAGLLPLLGFALAPTLENQFFPTADRDQFYLQMWLPSETSIEATRARALEVEAVLAAEPAVRRVDWVVGGSAPAFYYNMLMNQDGASSYAQALVRATGRAELLHAVPELQERLSAAFPEAQIVLRLLGQGPPVDAPVEVRLYGQSLATLRGLGEEVRRHLIALPEVTHTRATLGGGEPKLVIAADEDEAHLVGLSLVGVAGQLNAGFEGAFGGSVLEATEDLPVRVRFSDRERADLGSIASANLIAGHPSGATAGSASVPPASAPSSWIPLSSLGEVTVEPELRAIPRRNGERLNTIKGYLRAGALPPEVTGDLVERLDAAGFALPAGYRLELGGEAEEQKAAIASLFAYVPVLVVLMASTIVLSFRSFRLAGLMGAVAVLAVGLGFLAIWLAGFPYGFMAMIGTAGLIGVAINDSIVVLAAIRARPEAAAGDVVAITDEVLRSSRHIFSTTLTTGGGFLPLLLSGGGFWPPLAVVIAGGVAGATFLALFLVPSAYVLLNRKQAVAAPRLKPALAAVALLAGCTVGPDYVTPVAEAPATWATEAEEGLAPDAAALTEWWASFDDPLLSRLIERAAEANHDLRVAQARVREARALYRVARSRGLPAIGTEASATRVGISEEGIGLGPAAVRQGLVDREDDVYEVGFDASWELDVFGGVRRARQAATARAEAAEEDRRDILRTVLAEVARAYVELRGAQRRLAVARDNLRIQRESLDLVDAKVKTGLARPLELEQARAQLTATRSAVPAFQAQVRAGAHRLAVLVGEQPAALIEELETAGAVPAPPEIVPVGLPSDLLRRRSDVRRAERQLAATTADVGVAVADLYPRFLLAGAAGRQAGSASDLGTGSAGTWLLAPRVTLPIFQGGRIRANIRTAEARHEQALARWEQSVLLAIEESETALVRYARERERSRNLAEAAAASRRAVELAEVLYSRGLSDYLVVLDAQRTLNDVEDRLAVSETAVATGWVRIYKALGGGWEVFESSSINVKQRGIVHMYFTRYLR